MKWFIALILLGVIGFVFREQLQSVQLGFVDEQLVRQGLTRRIALTVPNFMFALSVIAETDLISALPKRFVVMNAARFGVRFLEAPIPLPDFRLNAVAPKVAMLDTGLAWLFGILGKPSESGQTEAPTAVGSNVRF